MNIKIEELLSALNRKEEEKEKNTVLWILAINGAVAAVASIAFPVKLTLATAATTDAAAPQGIVEVLNNLLLNLVANPVSYLVNANYVGILMWAILLGLAFRAANNMTQNVLKDVADGISTVVTWIINMAPFGIFGLVFNTVSTNGLDIFTTYGKLLLLLV